MSTDGRQKATDQAADRRDLARRLLARVGRIAARVGDVSLAAEVQLLKRELLRGHRLLAGDPGETNYLSVVVMVEGTLASLTWKAYGPAVLDALRLAFDAGIREGRFTFEDYATIRRHFVASGVPTGPTLDLYDGEEDSP